MSPRPRKASDEQVFAATQRVMMRLTPAEVTLADIAAEAGLTAGALVQRFGSKRELFVALTAQMPAYVPHLFAGLRAAHQSPLGIVRAYGACMAAMGESPRLLAHHLSWLQLDLTDPDMQRHLAAHARATERELGLVLEQAKAAGELPRQTDSAALARAVHVMVSGSLMLSAFYALPAQPRMREDLDALLAAFAGPPRKNPRKLRRRDR